MQSEAQQERYIQHGRVFHRTRSKGQYTSRLHGSRDTRNTSTRSDSSRSGTARESRIYQEKQSIRGRGEHSRNKGGLSHHPPWATVYRFRLFIFGAQSGQNHWSGSGGLRLTHERWNHWYGHSSLSQPIICVAERAVSKSSRARKEEGRDEGKGKGKDTTRTKASEQHLHPRGSSSDRGNTASGPPLRPLRLPHPHPRQVPAPPVATAGSVGDPDRNSRMSSVGGWGNQVEFG